MKSELPTEYVRKYAKYFMQRPFISSDVAEAGSGSLKALLAFKVSTRCYLYRESRQATDCRFERPTMNGFANTTPATKPPICAP